MLQVRCIVVLEHRTPTRVGLVICNSVDVNNIQSLTFVLGGGGLSGEMRIILLTNFFSFLKFFFFFFNLTCALHGLTCLGVCNATLASDICPVHFNIKAKLRRTSNESMYFIRFQTV